MHCHYFKVLIKSVAVLAFPFVCNMSQNKGNSMREVLREKKKSSTLAIIQTQFSKENMVECLIKTKDQEVTWAD